MYPHRIRLRGPWSYQALDPDAGPGASRVALTCSWEEAAVKAAHGELRLRRRFSWPARLDSHERLWLVFDQLPGLRVVSLNGEPLGPVISEAARFEFDVTGRIRPRDELEIQVMPLAGGGGAWGEVALEVRCSAHLRGVRVWLERAENGVRFHVAGQVVGTADGPLELYALLNGSSVIYATVSADPAGRAFALASETLTEGIQPFAGVRVELVNGGVVWYALEPALDLARG